MIQINATKNSEKGVVRITMRFIGKNIFIRKKENSSESISMINQLKNKGLRVWESREWIKCDLLGENEVIRLGNIEVDKDETPEEQERKLSQFYAEKYKQGGFIVETQYENTK